MAVAAEDARKRVEDRRSSSTASILAMFDLLKLSSELY